MRVNKTLLNISRAFFIFDILVAVFFVILGKYGYSLVFLVLAAIQNKYIQGWENREELIIAINKIGRKIDAAENCIGAYIEDEFKEYFPPQKNNRVRYRPKKTNVIDSIFNSSIRGK